MNCEDYVIERIKALESKVEKLEKENDHLKEEIHFYEEWELKVLDVLNEFKFEKKRFENGETYITSYRFIDGKNVELYEELGLPRNDTLTGTIYEGGYYGWFSI